MWLMQLYPSVTNIHINIVDVLIAIVYCSDQQVLVFSTINRVYAPRQLSLPIPGFSKWCTRRFRMWGCPNCVRNSRPYLR